MTKEEATEQIKECATCDYDGSEPDGDRAEASGWLRAWMRSDIGKDVTAAVEALGFEPAVDVYLKELTACHDEEYDLDGEEE